jgi:hypothetical protein
MWHLSPVLFPKRTGPAGLVWEGHGNESSDKRKTSDMQETFYAAFKRKYGKNSTNFAVKDPEILFIKVLTPRLVPLRLLTLMGLP